MWSVNFSLPVYRNFDVQLDIQLNAEELRKHVCIIDVYLKYLYLNNKLNLNIQKLKNFKIHINCKWCKYEIFKYTKTKIHCFVLYIANLVKVNVLPSSMQKIKCGYRIPNCNSYRIYKHASSIIGLLCNTVF